MHTSTGQEEDLKDAFNCYFDARDGPGSGHGHLAGEPAFA